MVATVRSVALVGVEGHQVRVEVSVGLGGVPTCTLVGLPDTAIREAKERVRAAITSAGFHWPRRRITVNLAPAGLPKQGSWFDLPIALGILGADGQVPLGGHTDDLDGFWMVGELGLDGDLRKVPGVLSAALCARRDGAAGLIVPFSNRQEASVVTKLSIVSARNLADFRDGLLPPLPPAPPSRRVGISGLDFGDVAGQETAKYALEVAAAGGHHCLMVGEPGSGKTMLARRLPSVLPAMSDDEQMEVSLVHSIAGEGNGLVAARPFRCPHHSASVNALVGGGSSRITPGEATLATCGVLFMDELAEFRPSVLNALRQPLEDGEVHISRRGVRVMFPARFMLVGASNPCPCGFWGSPLKRCSCDRATLERYRRRLSGPLLDRIDVTVPVHAEVPGRILSHVPVAESVTMQERVAVARSRQAERLGPGRLNSDLTAAELRRHVNLAPAGSKALHSRAEMVSSRGLASIQKLARTIADLQDSERVDGPHVDVAWRLRMSPDVLACMGGAR